MNLGEKLLNLRKTKNLTQDDVAEKLNVTRQTVSKWETNQSTPDFDKILPLCELYGISPTELLAGEKEEQETANNENSNEFITSPEQLNKIDSLRILKNNPSLYKLQNGDTLNVEFKLGLFNVKFLE